MDWLSNEIEECAKIADVKAEELKSTVSGGNGVRAAQNIAAQIRSRKS